MPTPVGTKGYTGNPNGRPRKPEIELVRRAMAETELEKKKSFWKHLIEQSYEDNAVLIAVARKFIPDLSHDDSMAEAIRTILIRATKTK